MYVSKLMFIHAFTSHMRDLFVCASEKVSAGLNLHLTVVYDIRDEVKRVV